MNDLSLEQQDTSLEVMQSILDALVPILIIRRLILKLTSYTNTRNPLHGDRVEGRGSSVSDRFCAKPLCQTLLGVKTALDTV
mgnify:CR=1 FL=1